MAEQSDLAGVLKDFRFWPVIVAYLVLSILLLLFKDLAEDIRRYAVPALVVYTLGASLISWVHATLTFRALRRHGGDDKAFKGVSWWVLTLIVLWHIAWFAAVVLYLCYKKVL
ncbi:MAG: hypothetical protein NTU53_02790 [Planctomycetota bacterium]|nr:hypothetical protein [Planctomycetota bacterium]